MRESAMWKPHGPLWRVRLMLRARKKTPLRKATFGKKQQESKPAAIGGDCITRRPP